MKPQSQNFFLESGFNNNRETRLKQNLVKNKTSFLKKHRKVIQKEEDPKQHKIQLHVEMQHVIDKIENGTNIDNFLEQVLGFAPSNWELKYFSEGQNIWDQDHMANQAMILIMGKIDIFTDIRDRFAQISQRHKFVKRLMPKQFFADQTIFLQREHKYHTRAIAVDYSAVLLIPKQQFSDKKGLYYENKEKYQILKHLDFLFEIDQDVHFEQKYLIYHHLYDLMERVEIFDDQMIYSENQSCDCVYIINHGQFQFQKQIIVNESVYNLKLIEIEKGFFGLEENHLDEKIRTFSMKCISDEALFYRINTQDFLNNFLWYTNKNYRKFLAHRCENFKNTIKNFIKQLDAPNSDKKLKMINPRATMSSKQVIGLNTLQQKSMFQSFQDIVNDKLDVIRYRQSMNYKIGGCNNEMQSTLDQRLTHMNNQNQNVSSYLSLANEQNRINNKNQHNHLLNKVLDKRNESKLNQTKIQMKLDYTKQRCNYKGIKRFENFQENYIENFKHISTDYNDYNFYQYKPKEAVMSVHINYKKLKGLHQYTEALYKITNKLYDYADKVDFEKRQRALKMNVLKPHIFV